MSSKIWKLLLTALFRTHQHLSIGCENQWWWNWIPDINCQTWATSCFGIFIQPVCFLSRFGWKAFDQKRKWRETTHQQTTSSQAVEWQDYQTSEKVIFYVWNQSIFTIFLGWETLEGEIWYNKQKSELACYSKSHRGSEKPFQLFNFGGCWTWRSGEVWNRTF